MCRNFTLLCNGAVDSVPRPAWRGAGLICCACYCPSSQNMVLALLCLVLTAHQITLLCHGATQQTWTAAAADSHELSTSRVRSNRHSTCNLASFTARLTGPNRTQSPQGQAGTHSHTHTHTHTEGPTGSSAINAPLHSEHAHVLPGSASWLVLHP